MAASQGNSQSLVTHQDNTTRYFCYQCNLEIQPLVVELEPTCPACNGGFVEEMEPPVRGDHTALLVDPDRDIDETMPMPFPLFGFGGHGTTHMHSPQPGTYVISMRSGPVGGGAGSRRGRFQMLVDGGGGGGPDDPSGTHGDPGAPRRPMGLEALFGLLGNLGGVNLGMPGVHGNPGDYVWGAGGLDAIITQLLNNVEGAGPPPADAEKIESLPTVHITATQVENTIQCFVCFDDFTLDEEVKMLPCKHHYHKDCIIPWLERHGTCPVCRKDLNGGDTSTTEFDANIGETIGSLESDRQPDDGGDEIMPDASGPSLQNSNNSAMWELDNSPRGSNVRRRNNHSSNNQLRDDEINNQLQDDEID